MRVSLARFLRTLPWLIVAPVLLLISAVALAVADFIWMAAGRRRKAANVMPARAAASLVIPNWNGKDLLERFCRPGSRRFRIIRAARS